MSGQAEQVEPTRSEQIIKAKELYSQGSRNYLVGCFSEAADELSQVCALYEEIYGELSDELGIPYLLYAKSLISLALDENKVIDVPDEEDDEDEEDDNDDSNAKVVAENMNKKRAADTLETIRDEDEAESSVANKNNVDETKEADSTDDKKPEENKADSTVDVLEEDKGTGLKTIAEAIVTSTEDIKKNGSSSNGNASKDTTTDSEKPSTSNGIAKAEEEEENEAASSLQLAWEILELAAKIFTRQGMGGLSNLAEVQTELANIEFENNILDSAREDYAKAIKIYKELPDKYRRAMAEIHYKVGLTYLMQQMNKKGTESLKEACSLIEDEITEINAKENLTDKDKENIKDLEETNHEIAAKIAEIEETRQQNIAEVQAALGNLIAPGKEKSDDGAGSSSSAAGSSAITSSSKPTDISHLIKRKKPNTQPSSEAEAAESPAKRTAL